MDQPETPPSTGLVAGKYQLVQLIGRGGMGSVWEARHASLGTRFAIKFIEAEYADSQEARSRFDKEARAAATIQSKHAIQIYDHGVTEDGKPYIVMEMLLGEPLDKRIERLGALSLQDTARIIQQVSRGLARAHERGIIHRDLKPENIFVVKSQEDDEEIAKVLDFGIAKIQGAPGTSGLTSSTKTGAVLGTPFYMSPEQARGLRNVDHRTDVWSLGVIAYKCISGKLPFDGESVGDLLVKICTAPVPVPSHAVPGLPPAFDAWFMRALEREPDRRFATVTELAEHLAFAAGIGQRGSLASNPNAPMPMSGMSTVASGRGTTPTPGPHHAATTPGGPMFASQSQASAASPAAGGMTAAPFTSEPVAGVAQPSRWKWVVGAALAGLLVAGLGTGVAVAVKRRETSSQNSVGITQPPPPVDSAAPPEAKASGDSKPADSPAASASSAPTSTTTLTTLTPSTPTPVVGANGGNAKAITGKAGAGATGAKTVTGAKTADKPPLPAANPPPVAAQPPPPPQPLPAPPPAAKKANKNDPGY